MTKTIDLVTVKNNEVIIESRTIAIPKFVADTDKWVAHLRTIYSTTEITTMKENITIKENKMASCRDNSPEYKSLISEIETLNCRLEKLQKVHMGYDFELYPDARQDRVARLFLMAYGFIPAPSQKDMDMRFKSIHRSMNIFCSRYNNIEEITPERTAEFKSIMGELISYLNGIFKNDGTSGIYKKHSVKKLSVGFVNDVINFCYGDAITDDKRTNKISVPSGALFTKKRKQRNRQTNTVFKYLISRYISRMQPSSKVTKESVK